RILHHALVGHSALHAFRNQLLGVALEVAVLASVLHGGDGSHASVHLVLSSLIQLKGSRALVAAREHASHHADVAAGRQGLGHVAVVLDAAVGDDRDAVLFCHLIAVHDG